MIRATSSLLLAAAALAVFWERLWRRLWPAACVAGMFVAVSLLDVLPRIPGWLHGLVLLIFAVLTGGALFHAFKGLKPVDGAAARRRLEEDNGLEHRPLRALEDNLAAGSGVLWRLHLERMAEAARALRVRPPSPGLAKHDPYGLRAAVVLFLVVGLMAAGGEAPDRLMRALSPDLFPPVQPPAVEAWITPPEYTGRPRIYLVNQEGGDQAVMSPVWETPAGGALLVQVGGVKAPPRLKLGEKTVSFESMGRSAYKAEAVIDQEDRISVEYGGEEIASWMLNIIPDAPPRVALLNDPAASKGRLLLLAYEAGDDYGVTEVAAVIRLSGGGPQTEGGPEGGTEGGPEKGVERGVESERLPLPLSGTNKGAVKGSVLKDLTAHAWAGLAATLTLEASDARGQTGKSEAVDLVLPERAFNHPVARAIIEARKKLSDPTLEGYMAASEDLEEIADDPESFSNDTVVYLALRVALARLDYDRDGKAVQSVREILWGAALRLEDGGMSIAEDNLRKARERLMQALLSGAGEKDIEALMNRLQQALSAYLSAFREKFEKLDAPLELPSSVMDIVEGDELQNLIDQARELARTGDMAAARRVLSELDRILGNIQAGLQPGALSKEMAEAGRFLDEARRLGKRQQKIVDDTFGRMRKDQEKRRRAEKHLKPDMGDGGLEQDALRRDLNKLMEDYGELMGGIPRSLGAAELDMREALDALGAGLDRAVLAAQSRALGKLREGAKEMGEQLAKRLGEMRAKMMMGPRGWQRGGQGRGGDPFGRRPGGQFGFIGGSLELPARMDAREAGKILEELRRRAGQRRRSQEELEYIKRLLKLF